jgi:hypothetical protein
MVQPKYSPEEALHRIKLMMEYDSSKTLSENEKLLKEDAGPWERAGAGTAVAGTTALGGWAGSAAAGALVGTAAGPVGTVVGAGIGLILGILGMNAWMSGDATGREKN